jgi:predicted nucleic acid-binding protein
MIVVVDANELFSLLIRGSKKTHEILLSNKLELVAPEFIMVEFLKHKSEILKKTHRSESELTTVLSLVYCRIKLIPNEEFGDFIERASTILGSHKKDVPYIALALKFNCPVWSEEKLLKRLAEVEVMDTGELWKKIG